MEIYTIQKANIIQTTIIKEKVASKPLLSKVMTKTIPETRIMKSKLATWTALITSITLKKATTS